MPQFYVIELSYSDVVGTFESKEAAFDWVARNANPDFDEKYVVVQSVATPDLI